VANVSIYLQMIKDSGATDVIAPFVVYNLPDRDCAAFASNGELSIANGGEALYKQYIDDIKTAISAFPDIPVVLVIEPDALANLVTNMDVPKCTGAASAYKTLTAYAAKTLALPNVVMYMDGGHSGWLGWPANIGPAATLYGGIYKDAGSPSQLRGVSLPPTPSPANLHYQS
jgi:cellulose 1,4-beta-cellobiosidase